MSLHVELSPEALERLRAQRRNSTISSFLVSVLSLVLVGLILGFFLLKPTIKEIPVIVTYQSNTPEESDPEAKKVQTSMERTPSAPSSSTAKVIASNSASNFSIPVPDQTVAQPSLNFGDGDDFGSGWGDGVGSGSGFANVPQTMNKRCNPQERLTRLRETGGTEECDAAVVKALQWMQKTQRPDGSWGPQFPAAMTGLALLAYLGHCETPNSPEFGETVSKALTYLINIGLKDKEGRISSADFTKGHHTVYEHGICTYALSEAYTLCKAANITIPDLDTVTKKACEVIIKGQAASGGFGYQYAPNGNDNSVGFWQIQAIKAGKHTGLIKDGAFDKFSRKALDYIGSVQGSNGAVGYRNNPATSPELTGGAMLCFQMLEEGNAKEVRKGMKYLEDNTKFKWGEPSANLYYHYYNAQAFMNNGGSEWKKYNEMFREPLLKAQASDGSWTQNGLKHGPVNQHMATCLATLMLEVYYRFLNSGGK